MSYTNSYRPFGERELQPGAVGVVGEMSADGLAEHLRVGELLGQRIHRSDHADRFDGAFGPTLAVARWQQTEPLAAAQFARIETRAFAYD